MNLGLYGLNGQPFGATPDPKFLYASATHREALASLQYAVHSARGFTSLIARPGLGKTTLLFRLLEDLEGQASTAFVFQTQCKPRELLRFILNEFSIDTSQSDLVTMHHALNEHLIAQARAGKRCVIILDEAQNLNDSALESVRLLSDFETPKQKLLHIVLSGQPELADKLLRPGLRQLQQRIGSVCKLEPLTPKEIEEYVEHRLAMTGHSGPALFTPAAMAIVKQFSRGIPRNINALCFAALSLGYALNKKQLDAQILEEAAADLNFDPSLHGEFLPRRLKQVADVPMRDLPHSESDKTGEARMGEQTPPPAAASEPPAAPTASELATNEAATVSSLIGAGDASAQPVRDRVEAEDPVARMEEEECAKRERELNLDPLHHIDLDDYALLTGTERRRAKYEAYQPHEFREPERPISRVDDEPDPELEALKRHLGQATGSTERLPIRGSIKQVLAIVGFAAALSVLLLIFFLWTRPGTSLAYSSPAENRPATPAPASVLVPNNVATPAAPRGHKYLAGTPSAPVSKGVLPAINETGNSNFDPSTPIASQAVATQPSVDRQNGFTLSGAAGDSNQAPPPPAVSSESNIAESKTPAAADSPESIVDTSQPGDMPLHMVSPAYPATAKNMRIAGTVVLRAGVDKHGRVVDVQKISGDPRLANAAIAAVQQWVYEPLIVDGKRQSTEKQIQIDFKLPPATAEPSE